METNCFSNESNRLPDGGLPLIAITMGDPAGIGAEIAIRAVVEPEVLARCRPVIIGDSQVLADAIGYTGVCAQLRNLDDAADAANLNGVINMVDMGNVDMSKHAYGKINADAGKAAFKYIHTAIELAMAGKVDAVVTGPIHKESLNLAGYDYPCHTEIFAKLTRTRDYAMMLIDQGLRVVHATTHVSLRKACDLVTRERVFAVIKLAHEAMLDLGLRNPRIGVAGLNPHSGEGGLFGTEEIDQIYPAIRDAVNLGLIVEGPVPPDTLFAKTRAGQYDVAVAMYHDQGHIPLKTVGFSLDAKTGKWTSVSGVNVTLGLPIIRTSVDHGVAFGKAGEGRANPQSMIDAICLASQMSKGRQMHKRM